MVLLAVIIVLICLVINAIFIVRLYRTRKNSSGERMKGRTKLLCCVATGILLFLFLGGIVYAFQSEIWNEEKAIPPLPPLNPVRSVTDLYPDFRLSNVTESAMMDLIDILIGEQGISAKAVEEGVNQLNTFLG